MMYYDSMHWIENIHILEEWKINNKVKTELDNITSSRAELVNNNHKITILKNSRWGWIFLLKEVDNQQCEYQKEKWVEEHDDKISLQQMLNWITAIYNEEYS